MYEWGRDYSHECQACFERYNAVPRQEPCYQHKGQKHVHRQLDDVLTGADYHWGRDDSSYDFSRDPFLNNRLAWLRWLWAAKPEAEH